MLIVRVQSTSEPKETPHPTKWAMDVNLMASTKTWKMLRLRTWGRRFRWTSPKPTKNITSLNLATPRTSSVVIWNSLRYSSISTLNQSIQSMENVMISKCIPFTPLTKLKVAISPSNTVPSASCLTSMTTICQSHLHKKRLSILSLIPLLLTKYHQLVAQKTINWRLAQTFHLVIWWIS